MIQKYLWLLLIILLFMLPITSGSQVIFQNESFFEFGNKPPSYTIVTIPATINTDPGETVNVNIYISGLGNIKNNKLIVFFPDDLLNTENPGVIGTTIRCAGYGNTSTGFPSFFDDNITLRDISISLQECNFMYPETFEENIAPLIMSERRIFEKPPIYISMNIAKEATPGDREVYLVFTYTDGIKWYQDKEEIMIHVNNPIEENRIVLLIILAILAFSFPWISEYTKNLYVKIMASRLRILLKLLVILAIISLVYLIYVSIIK